MDLSAPAAQPKSGPGPVVAESAASAPTSRCHRAGVPRDAPAAAWKRDRLSGGSCHITSTAAGTASRTASHQAANAAATAGTTATGPGPPAPEQDSADTRLPAALSARATPRPSGPGPLPRLCHASSVLPAGTDDLTRLQRLTGGRAGTRSVRDLNRSPTGTGPGPPTGAVRLARPAPRSPWRTPAIVPGAGRDPCRRTPRTGSPGSPGRPPGPRSARPAGHPARGSPVPGR